MKKQWVALSLLVPREFQEAVSNFLWEQGASGAEEEEEAQGVRLKAYFPGDGREKETFRAIDRYLKSLSKIFPQGFRFRMETALIPEQDWGENWKRFFKPLRIGSRFIVYPPWEKVKLKKGQVPIEITPGMAFGTGTHATTQLSIRALETRLKRGCSLLDVGTGSGILAVVAVKLGAQEVWAVDIDEVAIENARETIERNGAVEKVRIRKGGIGRIQKKFDLVVANIDFKSLKRLRASLLRHLNERGVLILSGILREQGDEICRRYLETGGLRLLRLDHQDEWACLTFQRRKVDDR